MAETQSTNMQDMFFDVVGRVRALEGKYNLLRDRALMINQNMVDYIQKTNSSNKGIHEEVKEIKHEIFQLKETMRHLIKELEGFTRREDIKVLEKYINLWSPMNFVTEEEVRKIIKEEKTKKHKVNK